MFSIQFKKHVRKTSSNVSLKNCSSNMFTSWLALQLGNEPVDERGAAQLCVLDSVPCHCTGMITWTAFVKAPSNSFAYVCYYAILTCITHFYIIILICYVIFYIMLEQYYVMYQCGYTEKARRGYVSAWSLCSLPGPTG